ncbi:MAG: hypothetical protein R3C58_12870, partial [Parvularculaceae bacterium]
MTQSSDKPLEQGAIPEVEAEVVETASVEAPEAAPFDDAPDAEEKPVKPRAPLRSPGVILFGVFALIALGIFAWWRFAPREDAVEPVETSAPAPAE